MKIGLIKIRTYFKKTYLISNVKNNVAHCGSLGWIKNIYCTGISIFYGFGYEPSLLRFFFLLILPKRV